MMSPVIYLFVLCIVGFHCVFAIFSNLSSLPPETSFTSATITQAAVPNAALTASPGSLSDCDYCAVIYDISDAPWASEIKTHIQATVVLIHDNSTNATTSTSTIRGANVKLKNNALDKTRMIIGTVATETLGEVVSLTYPTRYYIYRDYTKFTNFPVYANGTSFPSCIKTSTVYTNVFAIPRAQKQESFISDTALSRYESFTSSIYQNNLCREQRFRFKILGISISKQAVLILTATSTSIRSIRKPTAKPAHSPNLRAATPFSTTASSSGYTKSESPLKPLANPIPKPRSQSSALPIPNPSPRPTSEPATKPEPMSNPPSKPIGNSPGRPLLNPTNKVIANPSNQPNFQVGSNPPDGSQLGPFTHSGPATNPSEQNFEGQLVSTQPNDLAALQPKEKFTPRPVITMGSKLYTANTASQFVIGSQTLEPGGPLISVAGIPISLAQSASHVVIGGSTINLAPSQPSNLMPLTLGGSVIFANSASQFIVSGQTLTPGKKIMVSGTPLSLERSGNFIVAAEKTISISPALLTPPVLTIGDETATANSASQFIIGSQTLKPGGPEITVSGTQISLAPSASEAIIDGNTRKLVGPSAPFCTLPSKTITADGASQYVIDGQTLAPGSAITISGTPISLAPFASEVIIGTSTIPLLKPSPVSFPLLTIGGQIFAANSKSQYIVDDQTLVPGSAITVAGTPFSLAQSASAVVIGTSTIPSSKPASVYLPLLTIGGRIFAANSKSQYVVDDKTLTPGSAITVSGTPISLAPFASEIIIGISTVPLLNLSPGALPPLTVGNQIITANSESQYIIDHQNLVPGSPAITISGMPMSLAPLASNIVIGGSTLPLAAAPTLLPPLTIAGKTLFPNGGSGYLIGSQTLLPGAPAITVSGTRISLAPSASALVIGSSTIPLPIPTPLPILTIAGHTLTPNALSQYLLGSQTLLPGAPAITVSGIRISLAPSASALVIGSSTIIPLAPAIFFPTAFPTASPTTAFPAAFPVVTWTSTPDSTVGPATTTGEGKGDVEGGGVEGGSSGRGVGVVFWFWLWLWGMVGVAVGVGMGL